MPSTIPTDAGELLSLAVHEFRTPVTVVNGYLRMLAQDLAGPLTDHQRKLVGEAEKSCARLSRLVAEMSELANLEAGRAAPERGEVDLAALLQELAPELSEGRDRGVVLVVETPDAPVPVRGDSKRLRDALAVLATAVLREQGGACIVRALCTVERNGARATARLGLGVDDAARTVLEMPPDARLNETRGGLGLGLPLARRLVTALGGRVWSSGADRQVGAIGLVLPLKEHS